MQTIKTNGLNLDALKADIANNEIRVLVNGQPETVDFKQWCKEIAEALSKRYYNTATAKTIKHTVECFSAGSEPVDKFENYIYSQLDY